MSRLITVASTGRWIESSESLTANLRRRRAARSDRARDWGCRSARRAGPAIGVPGESFCCPAATTRAPAAIPRENVNSVHEELAEGDLVLLGETVAVDAVDDVLRALADDGFLGHHQRAGDGSHQQSHPGGHSRVERAVLVGHQRVDAHAAGGGVDAGIDRVDASFEARLAQADHPEHASDRRRSPRRGAGAG